MRQLPERPRAGVSSNMYILVGEVIGYTEPVTDPQNFQGSAVGVKLKPIETIHFPYPRNDYVEVFSFGHDMSCSPVARSGMPPLGTRLRLALYPATLVASQSGGHIRLESRVFDRISNDEAMFGVSTTAGSVFEYKKDLRPLADKFVAPAIAEKRQWLDDFLYIEASKDLLRFQRAETEKERLAILERLLYCPNIDYPRLLYSRIGDPPDWYSLGLFASVRFPDRKNKRLSTKENWLLRERWRIESSGELNIWKNLIQPK